MKCRDGDAEDGQPIAMQLSLFSHVKNGIDIAPRRQIVDAQRKATAREQSEVMARLDVDGRVDVEEVGDAILVAVGIVHKLASFHPVFRHGQGDGTSRAVVAVNRDAETLGELVVAGQLEVVRLVEVGGKPFSAVDRRRNPRIGLPQQRARIGVACPAAEFSPRFLQHQFDAVGATVNGEDVGFDVRVHQQFGALAVVGIIVHSLVVGLNRGFYRRAGEVLYRPTASCNPFWGRTLASLSFQVSVGDMIVVFDSLCMYGVYACLDGQIGGEGVACRETVFGAQIGLG